MIVKVKEVVKKFEPIELNITIETEEELCDLWHRLNISDPVVLGGITDKLKYNLIEDRDYKLWSKIDELVESNNLKNK